MDLLEPKQTLDDDAAFDLLADLERQTPQEIRRKRASDRVAIKAHVLIQPANASEIHKLKVQGVTGDLSTGGCRIMSPIPLGVGDLYRLSFDTPDVDVPMVFARCLRCRLIRENAFEAGFLFFTPVHLAERREREMDGDLLAASDDLAG